MRGFLKILLAGTLAALAANVTLAEDAPKPEEQTYLDPQNAGPDYAVQGEYLGAFENDEKIGVQVIALGGGKFDAVAYQHGLPGDGWMKGKGLKTTLSGQTDEAGITRLKGKVMNAEIKDGQMTVEIHSEDGEKCTLKKVNRESPTLGKKPPEGATVLFDGTTAEHFVRGKMTDDNLLLADCESQLKLGDYEMHLEFRTPFKPFARDQDRGNSGMYLQSRYEVQVLDSFGLEGKNNECGGIYSISEPLVNACFPPLTWQTYDVKFTAAKYDESGKKTVNARTTIHHNGILIHDNLELPHGTPGKSPEGPEPAPLYLQGHGNPVVYRNIWVVTGAAPARAASDAGKTN